MSPNFKKKIIYLLNFIFALSLLSICISALMMIIYMIKFGFSNLKVDVYKLLMVIGIPLLIIVLTKIFIKKLSSTE